MDLDEIRKARLEYQARPISLLIAAVAAGSTKGIDEALKLGANIDECNTQGETPLHVAARNGSKKIAAHVIKCGASLNQLDKNAMTPLMVACSTGKKKGGDVALLLLEHGADPKYVRADDGMDALKFAIWGECSKEVIQVLLQLGAAPPGSDFKVLRLD